MTRGRGSPSAAPGSGTRSSRRLLRLSRHSLTSRRRSAASCLSSRELSEPRLVPAPAVGPVRLFRVYALLSPSAGGGRLGVTVTLAWRAAVPGRKPLAVPGRAEGSPTRWPIPYRGISRRPRDLNISAYCRESLGVKISLSSAPHAYHIRVLVSEVISLFRADPLHLFWLRHPFHPKSYIVSNSFSRLTPGSSMKHAIRRMREEYFDGSP